MKGTRQPLENNRLRLRVAHYVGANGGSSLPICLFVFNIDSEQGVYRWLKEPVVSEDGHARLLDGDQQGSARINHPSYEKLDEAALDRIVNSVVRWYGAKKAPMYLHGSSD